MPSVPSSLPPLPSVSRETQDALGRYAALLRKWQARINLVSPATLAEAEERHFADSLQLLPLLRAEDKTLVDFGSGAGFPGLVLAIARPDMAVHLVESDAKKGEFMRAVSRETFAHRDGHSPIPPIVHTCRIEALAPFPVDVITARALASLSELFAYALPFARLNPALRLIFLKGENWAEEVAAAAPNWDFDLQEYPSTTNDKARILVISRLTVSRETD